MFSAVRGKAVILQRYEAFRFHKPQISLVELGGSAASECLVFYFLISLGLLCPFNDWCCSKDTYKWLCSYFYEFDMHVCVCLLDMHWLMYLSVCSQGSRRRSSLHFSRAWWSSWTKTCMVLTTTWSRSVQTWPLKLSHRGNSSLNIHHLTTVKPAFPKLSQMFWFLMMSGYTQIHSTFKYHNLGVT